MKQTKPGDVIGELKLPNIDNSEFSIDTVAGKRYLLSFYRFASCPFCNMRIHQLVTKYDELPDNFEVVAIFDSPLDNLQRHATDHHAPFPILRKIWRSTFPFGGAEGNDFAHANTSACDVWKRVYAMDRQRQHDHHAAGHPGG